MVAPAAASPTCSNCFWGQLDLQPNPDDPSGKTRKLGADFFFRSADQLVWEAPKGDITNGADIPKLFQSIIGGPFTPAYLPAAVIHDHYTSKHHLVRTWQLTHRMFYDGLIANHVPKSRALLMYYAVYAFGPHWAALDEGVECGEACVRLHVPKHRRVVLHQPEDYSLRHRCELRKVARELNGAAFARAPLSPEDIEVMAERAHPENKFLAAAAKAREK